ncbi:hypothetical protein GJ496_006101 [Pomphorhynchus laevis]|nr:hypothetical protein GJ496_006101 [Pomphorhynchus laevis]
MAKRKEEQGDQMGSDDKFQLDTSANFLQSKPRTKNRLLTKCLQNPIVPIGTILTVMALTRGIRFYLSGNSRMQQKFMRQRILWQGVTISAILVSMLSAGKLQSIFSNPAALKKSV